jgi:hypothetical protein
VGIGQKECWLWSLNSVLPLTSWVESDKFLSLPGPQFPLLFTEEVGKDDLLDSFQLQQKALCNMGVGDGWRQESSGLSPVTSAVVMPLSKVVEGMHSHRWELRLSTIPAT